MKVVCNMRFFLIFLITLFPALLISNDANAENNKCTKPVIFPLLSKPINDTGQEYDNYDWRSAQGENQAVYKSYRIRKSSKRNITKKSFHAARDLYTDVYNDNQRFIYRCI